MRIKWSLLIRLAVTIGVLVFVYVANRDDWPEFRANLERSKFAWLFAAFVCYALTNLLGVWRWHILLKSCGTRLPFATALRLTMIGLFTNNFLPGAMSGDVVRAIYTSRSHPKRKPTVIMSIVMERLLGFVAMFIVSTAFILYRRAELCETPLTRVSMYLYLSVFAALTLLLALTKWTNISSALPFWKKLPFQSWLKEAGDAYQVFIRHPACFWGGLLLSATAHLFLILMFWFISKALMMSLNFFDLAAVLPFIAVITMIPASINGWGMREMAFQEFLRFAGMTGAASVALSVCGGFIITAFSLIGCPIYLRYKTKPANRDAHD